MATTTSTRTGPRVRGSARGGAKAEGRTTADDQEYDLLTAALLGVVLGAGTTLLLRPRRRRIPASVEAVLGGARAAAGAARAGKRGVRWMRRQSADVIDRAGNLHVDRAVRSYLESAKDRIDSAVSSELRDLRKALRRQRRRLGL